MGEFRKTGVVTLFFLFAVFNVHAQLLGKTLATVRLSETEVISEKEMLKQFELLETQLGTILNSSQKEEVFQSAINSILIGQAANRAKLQVTENEIQNAIGLQKSSLEVAVTDIEYQRLIIEQTGLSWDEYRQQIEDRLLQEKYIAYANPDLLQSSFEPTETEIKAIYERNAQNFVSPILSRFSHIFIDLREQSNSERNESRRKMNSYLARIRNSGTAFDQIIQESLDDATTSGGDFGYLITGDPNAIQILGEEFVQEVFSMSTGDTSGILESNIGFHIVQITDRRSPRLLDLDDPLLPGQSLTVRQQIQQYIVTQKQQEALLLTLQDITSDLRAEADIRIVEANISW